MNAYISNELSAIKAHDPARQQLAAQAALFLSMGGKITEPGTAPTKTVEQRRQTPNFQGAAAKLETDQQAARIRQLAKTLNAIEICEKEGIARGKLRGIARRYGIEFTVGVKNAFAPNKVTPESEALMVIQIKECMDKGLNRRQCHDAIGISSTLLLRLLKDYAIDYPKMKPAFR